MSSCQKYFSTCLITTALLAATSSAWAQDFAVLAGNAVTCTDATVTGDVGTARGLNDAPAGAITRTNCPISGGTVHQGDTAAKQAYAGFVSAYADLAKPTTCTRTFVEEAFTGAAFSLAPGTYCFPAAVTFTDTTLTLDGGSNDKWLFKIGTQAPGALTGTNFSVVMGGGQACNVTWWVDAAATMTTSNLKGSLLAGVDITVTGGTFIKGDAFAGGDGTTLVPSGAVTLTGATVVGCEAGSPNPVPGPDPRSCSDRVTGGGYITVNGKKANFGVTGGIRKGKPRGHLTYIDHGKGLKVKGTGVTAYEEIDATTRFIAGTAKVDGTNGTYTVIVSDKGEPGRTDTFAIRLFNAAGDVIYSASGKLDGGDIQLHQRHCGKGDKDDDDGDGDDDHGDDGKDHQPTPKFYDQNDKKRS